VTLASGTVTYTPAANFFGTASFDYTISDGFGGTATGTVTVNVTPVNDPPFFTSVPSPITVNEGQLVNFLVTADDVDGPLPLIFSVSNLPAGATLTPQPDGKSAVFNWTPNAAQGGPNPYSIQLTISDGQLSDTKFVSIKVNDTRADRDGDGVADAVDNCPDDPNTNQLDVCHNSPQPVAAAETATQVDGRILVTFSATFTNDGKTDISVLPPTLDTVSCRVINSAGVEISVQRIPEGGPFVMNLGEVGRPGQLIRVVAKTSTKLSTTFDLRNYYPFLPAGTFTTVCTYIQWAEILNPTADNPPDPPVWRGEKEAPPQTIVVGQYQFSGFFSPLPGAKFSQSNTVPVKFALKDSSGAFVTTCTCTLTYQQLDGNGNPTGPQVPATSTSGSGNQFKYDAKNNQYLFTVASRSLPVGSIQLQVDLHDGSALRTVNIVVTP
jgi:hypothetical protein